LASHTSLDPDFPIYKMKLLGEMNSGVPFKSSRVLPT